MPYDEADETDPMLLVGVELPADEETATEAVNAVAEEYARMGFSEQKVLELFSNPFYRGAHEASRILGEERTRIIVKEHVAFWGRISFRDRDTDPETGLGLLKVLDSNSRRDHV